MKTQSIKSIITLAGLVAALNLGALAGPGPQPQLPVHPREVTQQKKPAVVSTEPRPATGDGKTLVRSSGAKVTYISGPRGGTFAYRD